MKSVYIRERRPYTKQGLADLFSDFSTEQLKTFITTLKAYALLKTVRGKSNNFDLDELVTLDEDLIDNLEENCEVRYAFNYVGIILIDDYLLCCYPKYLFSCDNDPNKMKCKGLLKQVLKVLNRYNTKNQLLHLYSADNQLKSFSRISLIVALLDDYFQNGIYINTQNIHKFNGDGEINWNRTINFAHPLWKEDEPYYINFWTRKNTIDDKGFIQRLHECLLTICSRELDDLSLLELLDLNGVDLTSTMLDDLGDRDHLLYRLYSELNIEFNSRKQYVLKLMAALLDDSSAASNDESISLFGTTSFNLIWEDVCSTVFDNKLLVPLRTLPLVQPIKIPERMIGVHPNNLKDLIERPIWVSNSQKAMADTLIPDLISIEKNDNGISFVILDAKYYTMCIKHNKVTGQPGIGDVNKQYLYQLAYKEFISLNSIQCVKNCFLMPTEEDDIISVGQVHMTMLDSLGLESIQVRELPASRMFECYLQRRKLPISVLNL